jgi:Zn finger protein HypA/HybF involved in hydrogenase expression
MRDAGRGRTGQQDQEADVHELGITQGILDKAKAAAQAEGAVGVSRLYVAMTPAADFTQDSIEMYFEMLAGEDDFFRGAVLEFEWSEAPATCMACGHAFAAGAPGPSCPNCGSGQIRYDPTAPMIQLTGVDIVESDDAEPKGD